MKRKWIDLFVYAVPVILTFGFLVTFLVSPEFYLRYILEHHNRESQACEYLTIACVLVAWPILLTAGVVNWRREWKRPGASWLPGGPCFLVLTGLAALFFAGEETSWGQDVFKWKTPSSYKAVSLETNLHNSEQLSGLIHTAGNAFLIAMFFGIPMLWYFRDRIKVPRDWASGIAPWPVVFCAVCSFLIRVEKVIFWKLTTPEFRKTSVFYSEYLEEISEQKEMLVAVAMLMFALYAWAALRQRRGESLVD